MESTTIKQQLIDAGIAMADKNLTIETWGNLSIRHQNRIYITPSGMSYACLQMEDICVLDEQGRQIEGKRTPSIESPMHVAVYQNRPDVNAILHTHALYSTVFAVLHEDIPCITDEIAQTIGGTIQCAKYALPGSNELAYNAAAALRERNACLLANHGAVIIGKDVPSCFKTAAVLESSAQIYQMAKAVGTPKEERLEDIAWMFDFAQNKYGKDNQS